MSELVDNFAHRLSYAITIRNIRPIELSKMTGISKYNISYYLNGKSEAKQDGIKILAKALNVNPVWLMGYDVPMENEIKTDGRMLSSKDLGSYLKKIREDLGYSIYDVNKLCNISPSYISLMENGKRRPSPIILKKLSTLYFIDYSDLCRKAGYDELVDDVKTDNSNVFPIPDTPVKVPVVGKISAGLPILATENIEGYAFAPSSQIKEGFTYFYLRVQGDSMNLKFNEGDIVLVQKQEYLENDEIGVILIDGSDATVKKYKYENGVVILEPLSSNPDNTVQIYNSKEININIVGKVVSYQGNV